MSWVLYESLLVSCHLHYQIPVLPALFHLALSYVSVISVPYALPNYNT